MLNPTPPEKLCDRDGHPYFLWDCEVREPDFRDLLADEDLEVRAYWVGKLMRQAKPDDVFHYLDVGTIRDLWPRIERFLGRTREFWRWYVFEAPRDGE